MSVEPAVYVGDFNTAWPQDVDHRSEGAAHIRLIKQVLQNCFPALEGVVPFPQYVNITTSQNPGLPDNGKVYITDTTAANVTITLPNSSLVTVPMGYVLEVIKTDGTTNTITFAPQGSDIIKGLGPNAIAYPQQSGKVVYIGNHVWRYTPTTKLGSVEPCLGLIAPPGSVLLDGNTIGNAGSGATYANAACEGAYHYLWRNFGNTQCPVTGGRGASAAADWAANKGIQVPDARGRAVAGFDNGGGAGRLTSATVNASVMGNSGGEERHQLVTAELASHSHTATSTDSGHQHFVANVDGNGPGLDATKTLNTSANFGNVFDYQLHGDSVAATIGKSSVASAVIATTVNNAGADQPHNNVQPSLVLNYIMWLA